MAHGWESSNGIPVEIEATGLFIDGEFLADDLPEGTTND